MAKINLTDTTAGYNSASVTNANNALVEAAIENTLSRDGTSPNSMNADLDMNSNRIQNLPNATNNQEPVTLGQANILASVTNPLTQDSIGDVFYPTTSAETSAGATVVDNYYKVGNVKRYGAVGDGVTDDSAAFNPILTAGGFSVYIPAGTYVVDSSISATDGILVGSNTHIYCEPGVTIRVPYTESPPGTPNGGMIANRGFIRFKDESNLVIIGNYSTWEYANKPTVDEQRHIFDIRGSSNVYIENAKAEKCGGDGYYVGEGTTNDACTNVVLVNPQGDDCRRQGLSIVSVKGLDVWKPRFTNIAGTAPEYGIDIEPNDNTNTVEDVNIYSPYTENCSIGIGVALQNLAGAVDKQVSINIYNMVDTTSDIGFAVRGGAKGAGNYSGKVAFHNPTVADNVNASARALNWPFDGPRLDITSPVMLRPNTTGSSSEQLGAAFYMDDDDSDDAIGFHGNIRIEDPIIIDEDGNVTNYFHIKASKTGTHDGSNNAAVLTDSGATWTTNAFVGAKLSNTTDGSDTVITANTGTTATGVLSGGTDNDWDTGDTYVISQLVKDVDIKGHLQLEGQSTAGQKITFDGAGSVSGDERRELVTAQTSSPLTFAPSNYTRYMTNEGAAGTVEIDLDNFPPGSPLITFEVRAAQILRIDPDAASHIYPGSNGAGFYVQSNNIGDRITLERKSRTEWFVVEEIGTWTRQV